MALIPSSRYPAQVDTADAGYPHGKPRNAGSYQDGTGTPLEKDWLADLWGFQQALLGAANITPSGDPDRVGASQYLEAVRAVTRHEALRSRLALRLVNTASVSIGSSGTGSVISLADGLRTLYAKSGTNGTFPVLDNAVIDAVSAATVTGIDGQISRIIREATFGATVTTSTRILAIGNGGTGTAVSTNDGVSWSAGGVLSVTPFPTDGVWNGTEFVVISGLNQARHSTTGATWASPTGDDVEDILASNSAGIAALGNGNVVASGLESSVPSFAVTTDSGAAWFYAGAIPSTDYVAQGHLGGNGSDEIYWLGKPDGVDRLDVWVSGDGVAWTQRAGLEGFSSSTSIRIHVCQNTGLLVAAQDDGTTVRVRASVDRGHSWCEPVKYLLGSPLSLGVANGRVFGFANGLVYASDRL